MFSCSLYRIWQDEMAYKIKRWHRWKEGRLIPKRSSGAKKIQRWQNGKNRTHCLRFMKDRVQPSSCLRGLKVNGIGRRLLRYQQVSK